MTIFRYLILSLSIAVTGITAHGADIHCGGIAGQECPDALYCAYPDNTCNIPDRRGNCSEVPEFCSQEWKPVLGCDGSIYSNDCWAAMNRQSIASRLELPDEDSIKLHSSQRVLQGAIRAGGQIDRRRGNWLLQSIDIDWASNRVDYSVRFRRSVRNAIIHLSAYCAYIDHATSATSYAFSDDGRTVMFSTEAPCGPSEAAGMSFTVHQ